LPAAVFLVDDDQMQATDGVGAAAVEILPGAPERSNFPTRLTVSDAIFRLLRLPAALRPNLRPSYRVLSGLYRMSADDEKEAQRYLRKNIAGLDGRWRMSSKATRTDTTGIELNVDTSSGLRTPRSDEPRAPLA